VYNTFVSKPIKLPPKWDKLIKDLRCQGECNI
jgi:hypothetical protein